MTTPTVIEVNCPERARRLSASEREAARAAYAERSRIAHAKQRERVALSLLFCPAPSEKVTVIR